MTLRLSLISGLLLISGIAAAETPQPAERIEWQVTFERPVRFHALIDAGLLMVSTGRHLYALDPDTGTRLWRQRNVNPSRQDVYRIPGTETLLVTDSAGGAFDDADTHVLAIKAEDGSLIWESPRLAGKAAQGVATPDGRTLYATALQQAHGDDKGFLSSPISGKGLGAGVFREPRLLSLDLGSGEVLWQVTFGRKVRLQQAGEARDGNEQPYDLGNYHRPLVVDRMLCVTYHGIRCLNRFTGATVWDHEFPVVEDDLGLAYAAPVVIGDTLYVTGNNRIHAFDLLSGNVRWRSRKANVLPEIQVDVNAVYSQLGGRFFHLGRERPVWKGEFGVLAVNRKTGKTLWRFDDAKDSITNLHYETDRIWFADSKRLYALDKRTGTRLLRARHRLKSEPTFLVVNSKGQLVLISDEEAAAYDRLGTELWSVRHPPPRPGIWQQTSAQLFQVSGSLLRVASMAVSVAGGLLPAVPTVAGVSVVSSKSLARTATRSAGNQLMETGTSMTGEADYAALEDSYQYFLTSPRGDDRVYLAAVDINRGETAGLTELPSASPSIVIDDQRGTLLQSQGNQLTSMKVR